MISVKYNEGQWPKPVRECVPWKNPDGSWQKCFCGSSLFIVNRDRLPPGFVPMWPVGRNPKQVVIHKNQELTEICQKRSVDPEWQAAYEFLHLMTKGGRV